MDVIDLSEQKAEGGAAGPGTRHPTASRTAASRMGQRLRFAFYGVGAAALLFVGGFGIFASHVSLLTQPSDPERADAIIVLTGGQARLGAALDLLKSGKGERLLISGVNPAAGPKSLRQATGGSEHLFSCCVDIDHAALDTEGNAAESAKWVDRHAYGSVILVTNNYHMPRSLLEMRRLVHQVTVRPYPVVNSRLDDGSWLTKPEALRVLATEYAKYLAALARFLVVPAHSPDDITTASLAHD